MNNPYVFKFGEVNICNCNPDFSLKLNDTTTLYEYQSYYKVENLIFSIDLFISKKDSISDIINISLNRIANASYPTAVKSKFIEYFIGLFLKNVPSSIFLTLLNEFKDNCIEEGENKKISEFKKVLNIG